MRRLLWIGFAIGALAMATRCGEDNPTTLSSLGLTGTFNRACQTLDNNSDIGDSLLGSDNYTGDITGNVPAAQRDNLSIDSSIVITNSTITVTSTFYDNGTRTTGTAAGCQTDDELFQSVQVFNVSSVGSAGEATGFDNDSLVADSGSGAGAEVSDNFTTHLISGTVGDITVTCYHRLGDEPRNGCNVLGSIDVCGMSISDWPTDNTSRNVNGAYGCYKQISDEPYAATAPSTTLVLGLGYRYQTQAQHLQVITDNGTGRVPTKGEARHLTLGYFGTTTKTIAINELLGPTNNTQSPATATAGGLMSHSSHYIVDAAESSIATASDNISGYWGGYDNKSNLYVEQ